MNNPGKIFWNKIVHARDFIDDIKKKLKYNKNIILISVDEIPWYESFYNEFKINMTKNLLAHTKIERRESIGSYLFDKDKMDFENYLLDDEEFFDKSICYQYLYNELKNN